MDKASKIFELLTVLVFGLKGLIKQGKYKEGKNM